MDLHLIQVKPEIDLNDLTRLCESRYGLVLEAARRFAPDGDLDRDIVQQTFLVFVKGVLEGKWALNQDVNPLFYGIAKRVALHFGRENKKNRAEPLAMIDQQFLDAASRSEEEEQFEHEHFVALRSCMDKLPEKQREFLEQHYMQNRSIESIARETMTKANSLRQIFCRMRTKLRDCIKQQMQNSKLEKK